MIPEKDIKDFYQKKFQKFGVSPKSLLWKEKGAAHQRFRQFWSEIDFNNKSVLDVGCGFGEFAKFTTKKFTNVNYTGIDIVPEFIAEAKKLYPEHSFAVSNYLSDKIEGSYDIVVASGILNSNVYNNMEYRKDAIEKLFKLSKSVTAFNMLGAYPQPENREESNVWYADSLEILKHCLTITRRVILRHHYSPHDFTVFMYKAK